MALQKLILSMTAAGLAATEELPGGKWCHTREYTAKRYGNPKHKGKGMQEVAPAKASDAKLILRLASKLTPAERALLLAQLS